MHPALLRASQSGPTAALRHRGRNSGLAHSPALPGGGGRALQRLTTHSVLARIPPSTDLPARSAFRRRQEPGTLRVTRELVCLLFHSKRPFACQLGCLQEEGERKEESGTVLDSFGGNARRLYPGSGILPPHASLELYLLPIPRLALTSPRPHTPSTSAQHFPPPLARCPPFPQPYHTHPGVLQRVTGRTWFLECEKPVINRLPQCCRVK